MMFNVLLKSLKKQDKLIESKLHTQILPMLDLKIEHKRDLSDVDVAGTASRHLQ
ncbi:hypothetical protein OK016_29215 [Vibrio chagasii]|nr:hypothetical protein [Vibrio chagasii]